MRSLTILSLLLVFSACKPDTTAESDGDSSAVEDIVSADPEKNYRQDSLPAYDFNKDGKLDFVELIEDPARYSEDFGKARDVVISTGRGPENQAWYRAPNVIFPSKAGGVLGDPFDGLTIDESGVIIIRHFRGSRLKSHYTHRFRFQEGDFHLIGATVRSGAPCDYFEEMDYNLSTEKVIYTETIEDCSAGINASKETTTTNTWAVAADTLPTLLGFSAGDYKMDIQGENKTIYY